MKKLTKEEYLAALGRGAGVHHFMGGCSSSNKQEILLVGDEIYLFEADEVGNADYTTLLTQMDAEGQAYADSLVYGSEFTD